MRPAIFACAIGLVPAAGLRVFEGSAEWQSQAPARFADPAPGRGTAESAKFFLYQSQPPAGKKAKSADKNSGKSPTTRESAEMRQQERQAIKQGDLDQAAGLLREGRRVKDRAERESWMLIEAEYRLAKKQPAAAGLAAMRLVILRPDSERVGEALYWAGRAYEGLKRPYKTMELYRQCLEHKTTNDATRRLAKARLTRLEKQAGGE